MTGAVTAGTKRIEVDPHGPAAQLAGIGERPSQIADGPCMRFADGLPGRRANYERVPHGGLIRFAWSPIAEPCRISRPSGTQRLDRCSI